MSEVRYGRRNPWRTFEASILEDERFSTLETLVYVVIASHATTTDQRSFPSYKTIAVKAKCQRRSAIRAVKKLTEYGLLHKIERFVEKEDEVTGKKHIENTSNLYIIFPADQPFDPKCEWIDNEGNVQDKGEVYPSDIKSPPLVTSSHHPSDIKSPPLVTQCHPNKTITNKTTEQDHFEYVHTSPHPENQEAVKESTTGSKYVSNSYQNVFDRFAENYQLTGHAKREITKMVEEHGELLAIEALGQTIIHEPRYPVAYMSGVLRKWATAGVKTKEDVIRYIAKHDEKQQTRETSSKKQTPDKPKKDKLPSAIQKQLEAQTETAATQQEETKPRKNEADLEATRKRIKEKLKQMQESLSSGMSPEQF